MSVAWKGNMQDELRNCSTREALPAKKREINR